MCRKLSGMVLNFYSDKILIVQKPLCTGQEKAKIETEFNYKSCCNDNSGLQKLGTEVYQPSTCSQKTCFYEKHSPYSQWISKQVRFFSTTLNYKFKKVISGRDCCLRYDPRTRKDYLVSDGSTWEVDGSVLSKQFNVLHTIISITHFSFRMLWRRYCDEDRS